MLYCLDYSFVNGSWKFQLNKKQGNMMTYITIATMDTLHIYSDKWIYDIFQRLLKRSYETIALKGLLRKINKPF